MVESALGLMWDLLGNCLLEPTLALAVFAVRIEFRGLVDLIAPTKDPEEAIVLMPNASRPNADWIPSVLRFDGPHYARLVIERGRVLDAGEVSGLVPTRFPADDGDPAYLIANSSFELINATGSVLDLPPSERYKLAQLDELVEMMNQEGHSQDVGAVTESLLKDDINPSKARVAARFSTVGGSFAVSDFWREDPSGDPSDIPFPVKPASNPDPRPYSRTLGKSFWFDYTVNDLAMLDFFALEDKTKRIQTLQIAPDSFTQDIHLTVKNVEAASYDGGHHFLAHYMIRENWKQIYHARYPKGWGGGAGLDPQCTPADQGGG